MFDRGAQMLRTSAGAFRVGDWTLNSVDPEGLRYMASVSVWVHWFMVAVFCLMMVYRPLYGPPSYWLYWLLYVLFVAFYACVHYRLVSNRPITWRWILAGCMVDTVLMTANRGGGFGFQPLLHLPGVLPCAGRLRDVLHLLPAQHGLCHGRRGQLPRREPDRGGRAGSRGAR